MDDKVNLSPPNQTELDVMLNRQETMMFGDEKNNENVRLVIDDDSKSRQSTEQKISGQMAKKIKSMPIEDRLRLAHEIDADNRMLRACCCEVDGRLLRWGSQFGLSMLVLSFCCVQLYNNTDKESTITYVGILSMIVGAYLPKLRN